MLTYKKYILRSILPSLIAIALILVSLVWVTQILKLLYLIDKGIKIKDFLGIIILIAPSLLFMVMPVITVLAVIYVYIKLKEQRQLLILRASGLSDLSLARPALFLAFLITIFAYYISAYLMPLSYSSLKRDLSNLKDSYLSNVIDVRTFNQLSKTTTIYVHQKDDNGLLSGIVLFDNRNPEARSVIFANHGSIIMNNGLPSFELKKGLRQAYDNLGNFTKLYFENLMVEISNDNQNESEERIRDHMELYIQEMIWPSSSLPVEKQEKLIVEGHGRIIWPMYNYALTFLALSVFLKQPYNRNASVKELIKIIFPLVLVTYFHFTLQKLSYNNLSFIFLCYANVLGCIIFSIWRTRRIIL
jgi:lipopolysaccharide export system permease protein